MLNRLLLLIHWIGFLCLFGFIGFSTVITIGIILDGNTSLGEMDFISFLWASLTGDLGMDWLSVFLWIGICHWPFNWVVTGDKTFLPWRRNR